MTSSETTQIEPDTRPLTLRRRFSRFLERHLPERLFARTLIIVITPMVVLQWIVAFVFMERHWDKVTKHLSRAVARDIAMIIELYESDPTTKAAETIAKLARNELDLSVSFSPGASLPAVQPKPFFSLLDRRLNRELSKAVKQPFWIDTVGKSDYVDIRVLLDDTVLSIIARRNRAYATNTHIFILWMVGASLVLLTIAIIFLRNQIRPIVQLTDAAESFGKGRDAPKDFRPRGAQEVQRAAIAFLKMRQRIERQIEQRTAMLAGVSHDLRTILTRFNLNLALMDNTPEVEDMRGDMKEMQHMLEDYLAFARGEGDEKPSRTNIGGLLEEIRNGTGSGAQQVGLKLGPGLEVTVRRNAFKRCISNLVENALKYGRNVQITAQRRSGWLIIHVDDDGIGIPEDMHEQVFRPFFRLDIARNQDTSGTGLGLAIARDIARNHGGEITLGKSPMGGLRISVQIPV
ncbi:MAG: two-component sensor histidine kinase [Hyphomicrobiales bacterium]|nr:MAG: two-component sensor histidine kinase [Hyphomicrobiales bacterium]